MSSLSHELSHLSLAAGRLGAAFARPQTIAVICVISLAALGWLYLALLTSGMPVLDALCRSMAVSGAGGISLVALMWSAMTLAMMLPSAAPMILTYAEIADTAARKREVVVSPFMLAAGYVTVWLGFAAIATAAQITLTRALLLDASMASTSGLFSAVIFITAGVYQFTSLKHACLAKCQHPFPFFLANWQTTPRGVFRLGVRQGLYCVGCCWAMMLVMFATGVMNVIWMAALGIVMTIEKIGAGKRFSHAVGAVLIVIGIVFVLAAHWPLRTI